MMATDNDDNKVDGNGTMGDDDGYVSYYNMVKLIIVLIVYIINFTA